MTKYLMILYRLLVYLNSLTVCSGDIQKTENDQSKKISENDRSTGHFQSLFFYFLSPTLNLKKNPVNQLIKKFLPKCIYTRTQYVKQP